MSGATRSARSSAFSGGDVADRLGDRVAHHALDILSDILAVEHLAALLINKVALHVHHVVKLERALSRLEVAALDGLLRLLERGR